MSLSEQCTWRTRSIARVRLTAPSTSHPVTVTTPVKAAKAVSQPGMLAIMIQVAFCSVGNAESLSGSAVSAIDGLSVGYIETSPRRNVYVVDGEPNFGHTLHPPKSQQLNRRFINVKINAPFDNYNTTPGE